MNSGNKNQKLKLTHLIEDHDEVILFCERLRLGLQGNMADQRLKAYADWFKTVYLDPHFEVEQTLVFPVLGNTNVRVRRALANHRRLERLFGMTTDVHKTLHKIEEELTRNIGFEERVLYTEIRQLATPQQWLQIENSLKDLHFRDGDWKDRFWENIN